MHDCAKDDDDLEGFRCTYYFYALRASSCKVNVALKVSCKSSQYDLKNGSKTGDNHLKMHSSL